MRDIFDKIPAVRDGLTREERVVLYVFKVLSDAVVNTVSSGEFLDRTSVQQLEEMRVNWSAKVGLLPEFRALVADRIDDLIRAKHVQ